MRITTITIPPSASDNVIVIVIVIVTVLVIVFVIVFVIIFVIVIVIVIVIAIVLALRVSRVSANRTIRMCQCLRQLT